MQGGKNKGLSLYLQSERLQNVSGNIMHFILKNRFQFRILFTVNTHFVPSAEINWTRLTRVQDKV